MCGETPSNGHLQDVAPPDRMESEPGRVPLFITYNHMQMLQPPISSISRISCNQ